MTLHLYDTLRRELAPFEPRTEGRASIYVCGPTVQGDPHIGHGRYAVVFDVLRRWLEHEGLDVTYVTNVTDIDDKIIMRAARERSSAARVATRYARSWNRTMESLRVRPPDIQPYATAHIFEMQDLIQRLIDRDKAYVRDGNVLFRVRTFPTYGRLSNRRIEDMQQGDELVGSELKEDPLDFAMWKAAKQGEPSWPSPWGDGRPGWHIECSAMAATHLGAPFDIHGGGLDLVFPHHENEIAQYEAAHDQPFVRWWVHNGMVQMGAEKMSKSLGNVVGLGEAVERWGAGPMRLWYLSAHHRTPLTFEEARLDEAAAAHDRLLGFLRAARQVAGDVEHDPSAGEPHAKAFAGAMDDDLNAPQAVAALHDLVTAGHDVLPRAEQGAEGDRRRLAGLGATLVQLADGVLGLDLEERVEASLAATRRLAPVVDALLDARQRARKDRDFARADEIRDQVTAIGVVVEDRPGGPRWFVP